MKTFKQHQQRVSTSYLDVRDSKLEHVGKGYTRYSDQQEVTPESQAIEFYLMNHVMALIAAKYDGPLPEEAEALVETYHEMCTESAGRMFFYLLMICSRETRHQPSNKLNDLYDKHGSAIRDLHEQLHGHGGSTVVSRVRDYSGPVQLGDYAKWMFDCFDVPKWSSAYGGKKWAAIADVLRGFVNGTITAEMMLDTAFTLAHNTNAIFNKGILYTHHSSKQLALILDTQRTGSIPQLVRESQLVSGIVEEHLTTRVKHFLSEAEKIFPEELGGVVDWNEVEANSVEGYSYSMEKKYQQKLQAEGLAEPGSKWFQVDMKTKVKVVERKEA